MIKRALVYLLLAICSALELRVHSAFVGKYIGANCKRFLKSHTGQIFAFILTKPASIEIIQNRSEADGLFTGGLY